MDEKVKIKAARKFYYERVLYEPGDQLEVSKALSIELISSNKAELFAEVAADEPKKEKKKGKGDTDAE